MDEEIYDEDTLDALYVEAIGSIDLADEVPNAGWDRLWADLHDPTLRDAADTYIY
jgi:hypothetical protein